MFQVFQFVPLYMYMYMYMYMFKKNRRKNCARIALRKCSRFFFLGRYHRQENKKYLYLALDNF